MPASEDSDTLLAAVRRLLDVSLPGPEDSDTVLAAVRLGWCVAEVRGRNRPDAPPGMQVDVPRYRSAHVLPLQFERTPAESRVAAQALLFSLAAKLGVDGDGIARPSFAHAVDGQSRVLAEARRPGDQGAAAREWDSLAGLIYLFDAHIQATLSVRSDLQVGAYQLGRALAECYWALDPSLSDEVEGWGAWWFLLGPQRCAEIEGLLGRLSAYMPPYTARAIMGSVKKWQEVAASPNWRHGAGPMLYQQVGIWYELAALGRDPDSYVRPFGRLQNSRIAYQTIRFFWGQMLLIALGVTALVVLVILLGSSSSTAVINTALGIVAAAGVSAAGLSAGRFRRDLNIDMLTSAITKRPERP